MKATQTILDTITVDVRRELAEAQAKRPLAELRRMLADAPAVRSFKGALQKAFGIIGEIKERSPSHGPMRRENVDEATAAYEQSKIVRAISVLTNHSHFGMSMDRLREVKTRGTKPVLRKDFIFDEYQVYEARAFGADAILLMANLLEPAEMKLLYTPAKELAWTCCSSAILASRSTSCRKVPRFTALTAARSRPERRATAFRRCLESWVAPKI